MKRDQREGKGEYTIQNFTQKGKRVTSLAIKQTNEINNKESKADSTGNDKEGQDPIFLCEVEEEGFKEVRKAQREENGERVISIPETVKREAGNRNNASEPEKSTTFLRQIHFPKSHEE